jgi:PAS domain S-box-containing protein
MTALRFLLLEDNPLDAEVIQVTLIDGGIDCDVQRVETRADFVAALETDEFALILAGYTLPGFDGISALEIARHLRPDTPFIVVSASLGEELAIDTLKQGATDYVLKQRLERLVPAVNRALREAQERRDRKEAEQERERFLAISSDLQTIISFDHQLQWVSPTFEQMLGWTANEMIGQPWFNFAHPNNVGGFDQLGNEKISSHKPFSFENRYRHKDGSYRWFFWNVQPYPEERVVYAVAVDVTERKQAQQQLQHTLQTLQTLIAASPLPIVIIAPDCIVQLWNPAAERLFGWSAAEVLGKPIPIVPPEKQEECRLVREAVIKGEIFSGVETYRCKRDDSTVIVSISAALLDDSNAIVLLFQDITEQQQAEAALRKSEAQLQTLFDEAPLGIYLIDADFYLRQVNPTALPVFGDIPDLIGRDFDEIMHLLWPQAKADEIVERFRHTLETGEPYHVPELIEERRDLGVTEYYEWQINRIPLSEGRYGVVCYFRDISAQVQARQAIVESEERLRSFVEAGVVGILFGDVYGGIHEANDELLRIVGYTREDLQAGKLRWDDITPPEYLPLDEQYIAEAKARGACSPYEKEYIRKDGSRVPVLVGYSLVGETREQSVAVILDLSDLEQTEDALRHSEARFRLMVESAKEYAIFTLDLNGTITSWNSGAERLLGYPEAEIIGCNGRIIFTPEDAERGEAERELQTALTQERAENERWHVRKDGSRFWGSGLVMPLQTDAGITQGLVKIMQDKTQSRQAAEREQFLAQSSAALAASIDYKTTLTTIAKLAVPFLADYCFFDVINANGQIERVAWYTADPAIQGWFDGVQQFILPQDFDTHPVANVLRNGNAHLVPEVTQEWMQSAATSPAHLQFMQRCQLRSLITVPLKIAHQPLGALTFCFTTHSDRHYTQSDLTLAEELARRAALALDNAKLYHQAQEANRIKDEFLAVLSHELRSPLNPILGWTRLLQNGKLDAPRQAEALATIERNARLQTQLIEDLLDISRIMQGKLTLTAVPVSLTFVISAAVETVRLAAEAKQIQILLDNTKVAPVSGDAARLQQVVWNLLTNAVKFTSNGGQVTVELRQLDQLAQIRVIDTGKGIDPQFLPHVFEYFRQADSTTTRKFGGLGLGLAIVRQIVEMHGGTVKAESLGDNQGATFTVQLPLLGSRESAVGSRETPTHSPLPTPHSPLADLRILVVDDDDDTRELQAFLLEQRGARVTAVASGFEALQSLDRFIPHVIVSDIGMADMDGYMLMQQIRSRPPSQGGQVPAIALTAYARDFDQQKAHQVGFQAHITKPVEPETLVKAIAVLLQ